nr:LysE family translocator [Microbacterium halimionae]
MLAFSTAAFLIIIIPGPSVLFVIGRSIAFGRRVGVLSVLGNALGTLPAVLLVAFGVGAIVASSVVAFTIIKFAGALYLAWLGIQAIRHRNAHMATVPREPAGTSQCSARASSWASPTRRPLPFPLRRCRSSSIPRPEPCGCSYYCWG